MSKPIVCIFEMRIYPDCTEVFTCFDYSLLKTNVAEPWPLNDELGLLLTTSGSVGSAKLVRQSYENIQANTESIIEYLGIDANERPDYVIIDEFCKENRYYSSHFFSKRFPSPKNNSCKRN